MGAWALAPGEYRLKIHTAEGGRLRVLYDTEDAFWMYDGTPVFESPCSLLDKARASTGGDLLSCSTPVEVGQTFSGTLFTVYENGGNGIPVNGCIRQ